MGEIGANVVVGSKDADETPQNLKYQQFLTSPPPPSWEAQACAGARCGVIVSTSWTPLLQGVGTGASSEFGVHDTVSNRSVQDRPAWSRLKQPFIADLSPEVVISLLLLITPPPITLFLLITPSSLITLSSLTSSLPMRRAVSI
ncbi:unnamed protein product [Pleuronectes platessa]|uniref:Uncharacterized protein n=1 Tax=Pleuronectes platessa TaxID=8262 RepID=A0A9N7TK28_PLEPL|nr:unnamed protein product [Pleuronectes platessa]